jgi:hypothetical protein
MNGGGEVLGSSGFLNFEFWMSLTGVGECLQEKDLYYL